MGTPTDDPTSLSVLSREPRKLEFARRLRALMDRKGIGANELARQTKALLPAQNKFQAANVRQYMVGLSIPRAEYLDALCSALGVSAADLVPADPNNSSRRRMAPWSVRGLVSSADIVGEERRLIAKDLGDGHLWLSVSQTVSWDAGLKILALLGPTTDGQVDIEAVADRSDNGEIN
jgi:transcriptional regulator with XRE-family HTH domain